MSINRVVALAAAACGLAGAIAVPLANLDTSSTIGVAVGIAGIVKTADTWLKGWQAHEQRQADARKSARA